MNRTLLMAVLAAAATGATAARADDFHRAGRFGEPRLEAGRGGWRGGHEREGWREEHPGWRDRGHQELRRVERWVGASFEPRWMPGACFVAFGQTRCTPGSWQRVYVPAHLEVRQEWVWVPGFR